MSKRKTALLMAMAAAIQKMQKNMGYQLDVSCTPFEFAKSLKPKRNGGKR